MQSALDRRQAIIDVLMFRRHDTMKSLAREFHVNERTIRRDICILSREYPIYTSTGPNGGVYIPTGYYTRSRRLTAEQLQFLERISDSLPSADQATMREIMLILQST